MPGFSSLHSPVLFVFMFLGMIVFFSSAHSNLRQKYRIERNSKLQLKGSSNVNTFDCDCQDYFPEEEVSFETIPPDRIQFHNTQIRIRTKQFNCHNGKIDQDMQKALKADRYPYIEIDLVEVSGLQPEQIQKGGWVDVDVKVKITICGTSRYRTINAQLLQKSDKQVRVKGLKELRMTDFNVDPPEAMFGLIKVDNEIAIQFDLYVSLIDA